MTAHANCVIRIPIRACDELGHVAVDGNAAGLFSFAYPEIVLDFSGYAGGACTASVFTTNSISGSFDVTVTNPPVVGTVVTACNNAVCGFTYTP
jgi:hypothetical protein